jgi:hypothetical protein
MGKKDRMDKMDMGEKGAEQMFPEDMGLDERLTQLGIDPAEYKAYGDTFLLHSPGSGFFGIAG